MFTPAWQLLVKNTNACFLIAHLRHVVSVAPLHAGASFCPTHDGGNVSQPATSGRSLAACAISMLTNPNPNQLSLQGQGFPTPLPPKHPTQLPQTRHKYGIHRNSTLVHTVIVAYMPWVVHGNAQGGSILRPRSAGEASRTNHDELLQERLPSVFKPNVGHIGLPVGREIGSQVEQKTTQYTLLMSLPAAPGRYQCCPIQWRLTSISKPL